MLNTERLIELRKQKKLRQIDVAMVINVERTTYVRYEKGEINPPTDVVVLIADYFRVSTDYLMGVTDNPARADDLPAAHDRPLDQQLDGIDFALYGEVHDLTDNEKQDILDYVRFKKAQKEAGGKDKTK